ncbi:methyltransferase domain-containing protein [Phytomonospora sp. NPDC050363]|uniref:methyltransferase domain-containing protein n=1 Tax=Phytomonospora sp. NPDC050363 TaxID=3155642 RepID=UPI0033D62112
MTTTTPDHVHRLITELTNSGALTDAAWIEAFTRVPRHAFTPSFWQRLPGGTGQKEYIDGHDPAQHQRWLEVVYSDHALVTHHDADTGIATSSSTQPSLMALMLEALNVADGNDILEIGTGSGYNCALLCQRLGAEHVTSIDIDPHLVETAGHALAGLGYAPRLVIGNGMLGVPSAAPYDGIIATCSTNRVPGAWVRQARPSATIIANIGAGVVRLALADDGHSASGRFLPGFAGFIEARAADGPTRLPLPDLMKLCAEPGDHARHAHVGTDFEDHEFLVFLGVSIPDLTRNLITYDDNDLTRYLFAGPDSAWMTATHNPAGDDHVTTGGPRDLWEAVNEIRDRWVGADRPRHDRIGLTVTEDGAHHMWIDEPGSDHTWTITT